MAPIDKPTQGKPYLRDKVEMDISMTKATGGKRDKEGNKGDNEESR